MKKSHALFQFTGATQRTLSAATIILLALIFCTAPARAQSGTYVVQPGDTLSEIAARYGTDTAALMQINGLSNGRHIWVGQTLQLSGSAGGSAMVSPSTVGSGYLVQPGDTLSAIAARYGTTVETLRALNGMTPYSPLLSGVTLTVSGNAASSAQTAAVSYSSTGADTHIVQRGESLGMIAARYGTTVEILTGANGLVNASFIVPGQTLTIPAGTAASVASSVSTGPTYTPTSGKWIDVNLSQQRVVAYENGALVNSFVISSGLARYPTVTGTFRIWAKTPVQDMSGGNRASGDAYYLSNVRWVQYFYEDYAFHAADWHNNFGTPMSRGCINMRTEDAKWLYDWAGPDQVSGVGLSYSSPGNEGTLVTVHY